MVATAHHDLIVRVAGRGGLDAELLEAQVIVESGGRAEAFRYEHDFFVKYIHGNAGAKAAKFGPLAACSYGLLQIMLETACELGFPGQPWNLFDPACGLEWGAQYFASLLRWADGDTNRALCAYNGGKGAALKTPYRTQSYADKVFKVFAAKESP